MGGRGYGGRDGGGYRGPPQRQYNGSFNEGSPSSSSSGDSGERHAARRPAPGGRRPDGPPGGAWGGRGDGDLPARVAELEAELAAEKALHEADLAKLGFVSDKVRGVAERSRNRGGMLVKIIASIRRVEQAKATIKEAQAELVRAEEEMHTVLQQATGMMEEEEQAFAAAAPQPPAQQPALARDDAPQQQPQTAFRQGAVLDAGGGGGGGGGGGAAAGAPASEAGQLVAPQQGATDAQRGNTKPAMSFKIKIPTV